MQARSFDSEKEARQAEQRGIKKRERHGYEPTPDVVARWSQIMSAGGSIHAPENRLKTKSKSRRYSENAGQGNLDF